MRKASGNKGYLLTHTKDRPPGPEARFHLDRTPPSKGLFPLVAGGPARVQASNRTGLQMINTATGRLNSQRILPMK